ncbi:secretin N-terminal domain-containing protein [Ramlibacter humi]|uniref:Secretion protein n=1 Tax=Ramlibacter humi TaxID=2530451 RepID=A0A4Z0BB78_9BURK|nr:secretin N-terminal domain-containing protein [Ramlibacter humi]TFY96362.1 secretion protein [Ramlibacter humi]
MTPHPHSPPLRLALLTAAVLLALGGCASVENAKGRVQMKTGHVDEGIESLENATRMAPTDAEFKLDYLLARERTVQEVLAISDKLRAEGKLNEALVGYERAQKMDRGNARAITGAASIRQDIRNDKALASGEAFLAQGKPELALDRASQVLEEHPQNRRARTLRDAAMDAQAASEQERSKAAAARAILEKPVTLQFNDAPLRQVFEALSKSTGLNVLMDRDVKPTSRATIYVKDIAVGDAIDFILLQNQLEKRVMNGNTIIVYPSVDAKKAEYEDLTIRSFQVTNADIRYLSNLLKTMLKLREVAADERSGILVVRDTPERIRVAARLIAMHDVADPEIMLEVEVLEVTSTRRSNLGVVPPGGISVSTPTSVTTLGQLKALGTNDLLVSPLSATINFKLEDSDTKLLASPRIRARNREKAKIMIGDRVPTITNTVTPINTGSSVVTGNVSYQDVGLKLEFEPNVYANNEVGIRVALEVSSIAAEFTDPQGGRAYQIGTRNATTNLRLKDGETQILGGLITDQDRNVASKIPGLGHLPVVGRIFGNNDGRADRSEIILAITPRIVRNLPASAAADRAIYSGSLNAIRDRPILAEPLSGLKLASPVLEGAAAPVNAAAQPASGGVIFNSAPTGSATSPAAPSAPTTQAPNAAQGLPVPPPMFVRPSPATK